VNITQLAAQPRS